jgi:hypothetical protein
VRLARPIAGEPRSAHLRKLARHGDATAQAALEDDGPECPETLEYLKEWAYTLNGRSGEGMNGYARLTYSTITGWAQWTGNSPSPADVEALFLLDAILLHPDAGDA